MHEITMKIFLSMKGRRKINIKNLSDDKKENLKKINYINFVNLILQKNQ